MEGDVDIGLLCGSVNLHLSRHSNSNIDVEDGKQLDKKLNLNLLHLLFS